MNNQSLKRIILNFFNRIGFDYFIAGILAMIFLAKVYPEGGLGENSYSLPKLANWGVTLIFFFYSLRLNREKLMSGLSNWKLHATVQLSTFLLFPLLILPLKPLFEQYQFLWLGTFFLASLPSTVSSSVVMVSVAGGNLPAAIFNASISGIIGIVVTPVWMALAVPADAGTADFSDAISKLAVQVLLPVILGFLLNRKWGAFAEKNKKRLKYYDQSIILIIVYTSFAESFARNMFASLDLLEIVMLGICMTGLFFLVFSMVSLLCRILKFNREDRISAIFCGSKKSLVHGTVMSKVIFAQNNAAGLILLPLMFYHAIQLIIAAIIAQKWSRKTS